MAEFFRMPAASPTMTEGVLGEWLVAEGASVAAGTAVATVETDKATAEIEVFDKAVVLRLLAKAGDSVPVDFPIAILGKDAGEDISALLTEYAGMARTAVPAAPAAAPAAASPAAAAAPAAPASPSAPASGGGGPTPLRNASPGVVATPTWQGRTLDASIMEPRGSYAAPQPRVLASPLAREIAAERGVNLARVSGSGPDGRIVAADVERAPTAGAAGPAARADESVRVTQMRKTIARRLTEAHQQVPVFYLTVTLDASGLVAFREAAARAEVKVSYNDILLKAVAAALMDVPEVNASWQGDTIVRRGSADLSVAVALPDGLITPVIRGAEQRGVRDIAATLRSLAARAREGKLQPEEYTGGSFSVSNLGMYDIEHFTAILNPPEAAILAVGEVKQVPVVEDGALTVGWRMKATLTCDHRVIDGALGARFLQALRRYVAFPALLAL
jgi:pyruvate dehydrogenase E2 component (dihydrolipoamide acetyltransferase)